MPKLFKKKTSKANKNDDVENSKSGRVRMSGSASNSISKSQMNEISSKLEALKAKYK